MLKQIVKKSASHVVLLLTAGISPSFLSHGVFAVASEESLLSDGDLCDRALVLHRDSVTRRALPTNRLVPDTVNKLMQDRYLAVDALSIGLQADFSDLLREFNVATHPGELWIRAQEDVLGNTALGKLPKDIRDSGRASKSLAGFVDASTLSPTVQGVIAILGRRSNELRRMLSYVEQDVPRQIYQRSIRAPNDSVFGSPIIPPHWEPRFRQNPTATVADLVRLSARHIDLTAQVAGRIRDRLQATLAQAGPITLGDLHGIVHTYRFLFAPLGFDPLMTVDAEAERLKILNDKLASHRSELQSGSFGPLPVSINDQGFVEIPMTRGLGPLELALLTIFGIGPIGLVEALTPADSIRLAPGDFIDHDRRHIEKLSNYRPELLEHRVRFFRSYLEFLNSVIASKPSDKTVPDLLVLMFCFFVRDLGFSVDTFRHFADQVFSFAAGRENRYLGKNTQYDAMVHVIQLQLVANNFADSLREPEARAQVVAAWQKPNERLPREVREAVSLFFDWLNTET